MPVAEATNSPGAQASRLRDAPRSSPRKRVDSTSIRAGDNVRQKSFSDGEIRRISHVYDGKNHHEVGWENRGRRSRYTEH
jgi:hypothetical protein